MGALRPGQDPPVPASVLPEHPAIVGRVRHAAGPGPYVMACSTLAGDRVVNRQDEELGTLEHIMVDVGAGRIAYGVLSRGGVLGLGARLFAVPWSALALDVERKCFVLDVPLERLRQAPGFDREHWPSMADTGFVRTVEAFYQRGRREGDHPPR